MSWELVTSLTLVRVLTPVPVVFGDFAPVPIISALLHFSLLRIKKRAGYFPARLSFIRLDFVNRSRDSLGRLAVPRLLLRALDRRCSET